MSKISDRLGKYKDYSYILWSLYLPVYLLIFFAIEIIIPSTADYWVSYCPLDDMIPFNEYFIILYWAWYAFLVITGFYLMFKAPAEFVRYMVFIAISFTISEIIFLILPSGQDLRPTVFADDNIFVDMIKMIYAADTNTNVLPSVHVVGSFAAMFAICASEVIKSKWIKISSVILNIAICYSTVAVKQHSILDVFAGVALSAIVYVIVYVVIKKKMDKKEIRYGKIKFKKTINSKAQ